MMKFLNPIIILCLLYYMITSVFSYQYSRQNSPEYLKSQSEVEPFSHKTVAEFNKDIECLAQNILMEAGIESVEGKLAVGVVTMNRVYSKKYGNTICSSVYAKNQFSWTINTPKNINNLRNYNKAEYATSKEVAKKILIENYKISFLHNAQYYYADYIPKPYWANNMKVVGKIGHHIFLEEKS